MSQLSSRTVIGCVNRLLTRSLCLSRPSYGLGLREKKIGHVEKSDRIMNEAGNLGSLNSDCVELIDENLLEKQFGSYKFKNLPVMHIICTRNNTKMSLVGSDGKTLAAKSAGTEGYKNCRKGTTVAAQAVAKRILSSARDFNINMVRLVFNGLGPGRDAAFKTIEISGLNVVSLSDKTEADEPWVLRPRKAKRI